MRVLYVSPLKALNQDISRNLQVPLEGILRGPKPRGIRCHRWRSPSGTETPPPRTGNAWSAGRPTS